MGISSSTSSQYCRSHQLDFPTSSTITGVHGIACGRQPAAVKPPCIYIPGMIYMHIVGLGVRRSFQEGDARCLLIQSNRRDTTAASEDNLFKSDWSMYAIMS